MTEPSLSMRVTVIGRERLENDFVVMCEGRAVGRIREATERSGFNPGWTWAINPPLPIPTWGNGFATSLDQAKAQFKVAWERFYATLTPEDIAYWHRADDVASARFNKS
jgi:hypothetical protein